MPGGKDMMPGGVDPAAMQKEIAAIIEGVKDIAALCKRDPRSASGEFKLKLAVGAEKAAKLLDAVNRALTLIDATPKIMPDVVKAKLPDRLSKSPFDKDALDKWKAYISAAKYLLEAIASFYQGCRSVSDTLESWSAAKEAGSLAEKQLRPTGGGAIRKSRSSRTQRRPI